MYECVFTWPDAQVGQLLITCQQNKGSAAMLGQRENIVSL